MVFVKVRLLFQSTEAQGSANGMSAYGEQSAYQQHLYMLKYFLENSELNANIIAEPSLGSVGICFIVWSLKVMCFSASRKVLALGE